MTEEQNKTGCFIGSGENAVEFARIFGLETKNLIGFTVRCYPSELVTINADYVVDRGAISKVHQFLEDKHLRLTVDTHVHSEWSEND